MARKELRERILDAAAQVLREKGPGHRLITSIAERAEVSRPTLYRHFPERSDLYDSLVRLEMERVVDDVVHRARRSSSPRDDYIDMVVDLVTEAREHAALQAVLARHPEIMASHLPRILPIVLEIAEPRLSPVLAAGAASGRWPDIDTPVAVTRTGRMISSLVTKPHPEDSGPRELRASVEGLLDVTTKIALAVTQGLHATT